MTIAPHARQLLTTLQGQQIYTVTGRPNQILRINGTDVIVATSRSPQGTPIPIEWVQDALDKLMESGEIEVSVNSLGYRSAFVEQFS